MKLRRRIGSVFLAFAMALSLIPSVAVSALAATPQSDNEYFTFDYDNNGTKKVPVTINLYAPDQETPIDTLTVNDARGNQTKKTITLTDKISSRYDIERVEIDGGNVGDTTLHQDSYEFWLGLNTVSSSTISVYLCPQFEPPYVPEKITGYGDTRTYRIYDDQILKMLASEEVTVTKDTKITGVQPVWVQSFGPESDKGFIDENRETDYWDNIFTSNSADVDEVQPDNIRKLVITYQNGDSSTQQVEIYSGDLRYLIDEEASTPYYRIELNDDTFHIVYFYNEKDGASSNNYTLYDVKFVDHGNSLGDNMPKDPTYNDVTTRYEFVAWTETYDGGKPFLSTTVVNEDTVVYAQKALSTITSASPWIHVMNNDNLLKERIAELYGVAVNDIDWGELRIAVYGENDEHTNPDYGTQGGLHNKWNNDSEYFSILNFTSGAAGTNWDTDPIPAYEITKIGVYIETTDGQVSGPRFIEKGLFDGDFAVSTGKGGSDALIELYINSDEYPDDPNAPEPEPEYTITGIDKELVGSAAAVPDGIDADDYTFPVNGTVLIPNDGSVTLLYAITVTGEEGATFSVTDTGAQLVMVSGIDVSGNDGTFNGTIPADGTITFYVSKTFEANDIDRDGYLTNNVTVDGTNDNEEDPDSNTDTETVPADEAYPVYTYVLFKGAGDKLTEAEKEQITETYGGEFEDGNDYLPIGYFLAPMPDPLDEGDDYTAGTDYKTSLLEGITPYMVNFTWLEDVHGNAFDLDEMEWINLSIAYGALDFGSELDDDCWHLDGKITLSDIPQTPEQVTITYHGNGGSFSNQWGTHTETNETGTYGSEITLYNTTYYFQREGYTNLGWSTTENGNVEFHGAAKVTLDDKTFDGLSTSKHIDLYAVWEKNAPTFDELSALGLKVTIDCVSNVGHDDGYVPLIASTPNNPTCVIEKAQGTDTYTVSICDPDDYIAKYNEMDKADGYTHTYAGFKDSVKAFVVQWTGSEWTVTQGKVTILAKCMPEAPIEDALKALLDDAVKVQCVEVTTHNCTFDVKEGYTVSGPTADGKGGWTYTVTVTAEPYVTDFNTKNVGEHWLVDDDADTKDIVLTWNADSKTWTRQEQVVFNVICKPDAPTEPDIPDILGADDAILVKCVSDAGHDNKSKTYDLWADDNDEKNRYDIGDVESAGNGTWTCEVTILPEVYVNQYSDDTGLTHWLTDNNPDQIVTLTWTKDTGWTASDKGGDAWATFEVTCLPEKPTYDDLTDDDDTGLLDGKDAVKVICVDDSHGAEVYKELWDNKDGKTRYEIGDVVRDMANPDLITCDVTILPEVYVNQYNTNTKVDHWLTDDTPQTITLTWDLTNKVWTAPTEWTKDAWAVFEVSCAAITITPADIVIYTGGEGYAGVTTNEEGVLLENPTVSGLPEPGYHIELPEAVKAWLKNNGIDTDTEAANLAEILDFAYNYDNETRSWDMTRAGVYDADVATGAPTRYVYTLDAAQVGDETIPVRILYFEDSNNNGTYDDGEAKENDQITMSAEAAHANYLMTINPGELDQSQIKAVFTTEDGSSITCNVNIGTGDLTVKSVADENPDTNAIAANGDAVADGTLAAVDNGTVDYYVNDSEVKIENVADRVQLLVDSVSNNDSFNNTMAQDAISEVVAKHGNLSDAQTDMAYLDLVDTKNGNAVVTPSDDVTIYWPMPDDADPSGDFYIVHYDEMDRTDTDMQTTAPEVKKASVTQDDNHLTFATSSFSPFVLVYEQKDSGTPTPPPVDPDDPTPPPVNPNPPQLNTEDHYAYIVGYEDGTVRPEGDITRAEVATIFFRLLTDESRDEYWSQTNDYTDVAEGDWYNNAVSTLSKAGILNGYEDGSFQPNGNITRAEFATIAARFFEATYEGEDLFPDIEGHWARDYINQAAHAGIVNGYENGTFRPQENITRAEAMTIVNRTLDRHPDADHFLADMVTWPDNLESAWYYEQVQEATNSHEYVMKTDADKNSYEIWKKILPVRDWSDLENTWSEAHAG